MFLNKWTTQLEPTRLFLQKTCCCFIAGLLLIARAVILLESWTRAQDLLEHCHFTVPSFYHSTSPSPAKNKTQIPPEFVTCSPRTLCTSEVNSSSVKYQGQRWNAKHPWRIQLQFVSCSQPKWLLCAKKSKPKQLWVTRAFTRCSQPITFAFEASLDIVVTEMVLPTWPFEVSHPQWWLPIRSAGKECSRFHFWSLLKQHWVIHQVQFSLLSHKIVFNILQKRQLKTGAIPHSTLWGRLIPLSLRIISLDDNCHSYQNCSVNLIKHLVWVLSTLQIHRANHQGHIVQITPEN